MILQRFTQTLSRQSSKAHHAATRLFSIASNEVIPGIGKGKTSTGIVSTLINLFFANLVRKLLNDRPLL